MSQATTAPNGPITSGPYPELSKQAVFVGYFLGVIFAFSISYASLKLGFSIEGPELAAILGFGIPTEKYIAGVAIGVMLSALQGGLGITVSLDR